MQYKHNFCSSPSRIYLLTPQRQLVFSPYHHLRATVTCFIGVLFFHLLHFVRFCHIGHLRRVQILNPTPKSSHRSSRRISALLHPPRPVPSCWQQTPDSQWQLRRTGRPTETLMCWDGPPDLIYVIHREAGSSCITSVRRSVMCHYLDGALVSDSNAHCVCVQG